MRAERRYGNGAWPGGGSDREIHEWVVDNTPSRCRARLCLRTRHVGYVTPRGRRPAVADRGRAVIGLAPSLSFAFDGAPDGGELMVTILFAGTALIAISMIASVLGDSVCQARVASAAKSAAHDAALESSADRALLAARRAAADTLTDLDRFGRPMILVDVSRFHSAGLVEVTVACTVAPRPIGPIDRAPQLHQATASASSHPHLPAH